jgi:dimethylaniline monooxygenase (N-oxide forming)
MDIAVEASGIAERVFLAARRGAWIVPKYVFGRPLDQFVTAPRIPLRIRQRIMHTTLRAAVGDMERYGLPTPDHRVLEAHPTVSDTILTCLTHGDITPKPNIARLTSDSVVFADGSVERADVVVYGTGYKVSFPFFDPALVSAPDNELPLFKRVFHPDLAGLYFLALLQPLGATMPLAEAQSEWICDHLTGRYTLPPRSAMLADIARERAAMRRRYVPSKRHTMQVDYDDYLFDVRRERKRGAARRASAVSAGLSGKTLR